MHNSIVDAFFEFLSQKLGEPENREAVRAALDVPRFPTFPTLARSRSPEPQLPEALSSFLKDFGEDLG